MSHWRDSRHSLDCDIMTLLRDHRRLHITQCARCGAVFTGLSTRKFCSAKCRQRHHRLSTKTHRPLRATEVLGDRQPPALTFNRRLILATLADDWSDCGGAPYSASSVHYVLESMLGAKGFGIYSEMLAVPGIAQIHKTLKDLWHSGHIVGTRTLQEPYGDGLPQRVIAYQLSSDVTKNWITAECKAVHSKTKKAKFGVSWFGGEPFGFGLEPDEVLALIVQVKSLLQKCHPDRAPGFEEQFKLMQECKAWLKSGIPTPKQVVARVSKRDTARIKS